MDEEFVVLTSIPITDNQRSQMLVSRFLLRKLGEPNPNDMTKIYIPVNNAGNSQGFLRLNPLSREPRNADHENSLAVVRYPSASDAEAGVQTHSGTVLDRTHTMVAEQLGDSEAFEVLELAGIIDDQRVQGIVPL